MEKLTDEQLKVLGTAIGAGIVTSLKSHLNSIGVTLTEFLQDLTENLGTAIADSLASNIYYNENKFVAIFKRVFRKN